MTTLLSGAENPQTDEAHVNKDIARLEGEVSEQEKLVFQLDKVGFPLFCHAWVFCAVVSHSERGFVYLTGFESGTCVTLTQ